MKRKIICCLIAVLFLAALAAIPFLCSDCALSPDRVTDYYEERARRDADEGEGAEAELMRLLLGGAPQEEKEPSHPAFSLYGLGLACAAVLGGAVSVLLYQGRKGTMVCAAALAVPLGLLGARLFFCGASAGFFLLDLGMPEAMLRIWEGGLSLSGAVILASLAGPITARITGEKTGGILRGLAPGMLLFAAGARLMEWAIQAGYGPEAGFSLPVLTQTVFGTARLNTALLMALCALILAALRKDFGRSAFLYGGTLILLESLRRDGHLLWGFVHAEQVFALAITLAALLYFAARAKKLPHALVLTAALAGAVVGLEFALDRSPVSDLVWYALYILTVGAYLFLGLGIAKKADKRA